MEVVKNNDTNYLVVVDGGSTGSRLFIYKWEDPFTFFKNKPSPFMSHNETLAGPNFSSFEDKNLYLVKKLVGGISSYANNDEGLRNQHLKPLIDFANEHIPESSHHKTPFYFLMTAGMRVLDKKSQKSIMKHTCNYLKTNSNFFIPNCKNHIKIITGDEEGIYAWISGNYLLNFRSKKKFNKDFINLIEMGGASTQIVFSDNKLNQVHDYNHVYNLNFSFYKKKLSHNKLLNQTMSHIKSTNKFVTLYSKSFLNYGLVRAQEHYHKFIFNEFIKKKSHNFNIKFLNTHIFVVPDPCFSKGYDKRIKYGLYNVKFFGTSDFERCNVLTFKMFNNSHVVFNKDENNVHNFKKENFFPTFDNTNKNFIAINGFKFSFDTMININTFITKGYRKNTLKRGDEELKFSVENNIKHLCSLDFNNYNSFISTLKDVDEYLKIEAHNICFYNNWIYHVITKGFHFTFDKYVELSRINLDSMRQINSNHSLIFSDFINRSQLSWTLGFAYFYMSKEYSIAYGNEHLHLQRKRDKRQNGISVNPGIFDHDSKPLEFSSYFNNLVLRPGFDVNANKRPLISSNKEVFGDNFNSSNLMTISLILFFFVLISTYKLLFNTFIFFFLKKNNKRGVSKIKK